MPTFNVTAPDGKKYKVTGETPEGAMQALQKMLGRPAEGHDVPEYVPPGVEGYDPKTGMVSRYSMPGSAAMGAADTATFGWGDEAASYLGSQLTGVPRDQVLAEMRGNAKSAQAENPGSYLTGQIAGGVAQGIASSPLTASARFAGSTLAPRVLAGAVDGLVGGGIYGAGSGEDANSRLWEGLKGAGIGAVAGGAFPLVSAGAGKLYEAARNALGARQIASEAGASPEALRLLGDVMEADGSLGPAGQASIARAGPEGMLADAGPNARTVLDTAIQRGGHGAVEARQAIADRTGRSAEAITSALDSSLGSPQGITAARTAIREGSTGARGDAYGKAYGAAIDYAAPEGRALERLIKGRVPSNVVSEANALMRLNGEESAQILARVADDGSVAFEQLPDVRQIDYITRALNQAAQSGDGAGALGGQTPKGRAYQNLAGEIRDTLKGLVPEYGQALETAADPIRRSQAVDLGSKLLSPSMTRDQVGEAVQGMTGPEREALAQGARSRLDDLMANVTRTVQDGDTTAREAIKAIKDLSSRANREKLSLAIGDDQATALFDEIDRAAKSFDLRASVTENSKTFARQATERQIGELTQPGAIGKALQGEPIKATKSIVQALTGMTPERIKGREDAIYSDIARLLTRQGGAGQGVYDAVGQLGKADRATALMRDRIARSLLGPRFSYPATTLALPYTER